MTTPPLSVEGIANRKMVVLRDISCPMMRTLILLGNGSTGASAL